MDQRLKEGLQLMKEGKSLAGTHLFRWKPDWLGSAQHYERASICFKAANDMPRVIEALRLAADSYHQADSPFLAAKHLESAAYVACNLNQTGDASQLYLLACQYYRENNNPDKACDCLLKGARAIEAVDTTRAIDMIQRAIDIYETEDREIFSEDAFRQLTSLMLRTGRVADCIPIMRQRLQMCLRLTRLDNAHKCILSLIILHLGLPEPDFPAARRTYDEFHDTQGFFGGNEDTICVELLNAFDQGDEALLARTQEKQVITFLDQQVARLAKALRIPPETGA